MAKAILIDFLQSIHGSLSNHDQFYIRQLNGKIVIQRKPNRSTHIATEAEIKNREKFVKKYANKKRFEPKNYTPAPLSPSEETKDN